MVKSTSFGRTDKESDHGICRSRTKYHFPFHICDLMMTETLKEPLSVANAVIDSMSRETCSCSSLINQTFFFLLFDKWSIVTDDDLLRLQHTFPEQTIIGALDLIDRGNGNDSVSLIVSWTF